MKTSFLLVLCSAALGIAAKNEKEPGLVSELDTLFRPTIEFREVIKKTEIEIQNEPLLLEKMNEVVRRRPSAFTNILLWALRNEIDYNHKAPKNLPTVIEENWVNVDNVEDGKEVIDIEQDQEKQDQSLFKFLELSDARKPLATVNFAFNRDLETSLNLMRLLDEPVVSFKEHLEKSIQFLRVEILAKSWQLREREVPSIKEALKSWFPFLSTSKPDMSPESLEMLKTAVNICPSVDESPKLQTAEFQSDLALWLEELANALFDCQKKVLDEETNTGNFRPGRWAETLEEMAMLRYEIDMIPTSAEELLPTARLHRQELKVLIKRITPHHFTDRFDPKQVEDDVIQKLDDRAKQTENEQMALTKPTKPKIDDVSDSEDESDSDYDTPITPLFQDLHMHFI